MFRPVLYLRARWWTLALSSREKKEQWLDSLSPIGKSPFEVHSVYKTWASIDECDYNMHLSNSSYAKINDMGRLKSALALFSTLFRDGGWMALGATYYSFLREIPIGTKYEVRLYIGSWDNKWVSGEIISARCHKLMIRKMYVIARYVSKSNRSVAQDQARRKIQDEKALKDRSSSSPSFQGIAAPELHTPAQAETSETPGATTPPANGDNEVKRLWEEGPNETLHCVSVSQLCFKVGRVTIPPALALASAGFGVPADRWSEVKRHRQSRAQRESGMPSMRELLAGKWRDVPEDKRWWDDAVKPFEAERVKRLEALLKLREGMDGVKNI